MWLGLVFIGYFVVSAALDDLDIEVSTVNRFHGDDGGGDEVGGMTPRSSKRMHSAAPGISLMAMGSPEMEMADNMAMSFDVPPSMAHQRSARSSRMHEGSTGSSTSFSSPNSQSLGVSFIEGAPSASFDPASVQTMLVRTGSVDISTDKVSNSLESETINYKMIFKMIGMNRTSCINGLLYLIIVACTGLGRLESCSGGCSARSAQCICGFEQCQRWLAR
jgi:hypothetical protein